MKKILRRIYFFLFVILTGWMAVISCQSNSHGNKQFVWDVDVRELTGGDLGHWLRKVPLNNEINKNEDGRIVLTNSRQVFPFMGRYYNAEEELKRGYGTGEGIYTERVLLFKDSTWGDLFVHATLLYDHQEVFLNDKYFRMGDPFFGGIESATEMHRSSLVETSVTGQHPKYKTGFYWVLANDRNYLMGFYQQGQLVFESVVPLLDDDTLATLNKLKEIGNSLGLQIKEWENADVAHLHEVAQPTTFWQDPFLGLYPDALIDAVYLKIKDTDFGQDKKARKGDYFFSYRSKGGEVTLYTVMQQTELSKEAFNKANRKMDCYTYRYDTIFYEEHPKGDYVDGTAKTYFNGHQYLEIHFSYPSSDEKAKKQVHGVLSKVRTLNF